jgi:hypothetical protein
LNLPESRLVLRKPDCEALLGPALGISCAGLNHDLEHFRVLDLLCRVLSEMACTENHERTARESEG